MSMLPFWNRAGGIEKLDGIPISVKDWVAGDLENLDDPNILELLNLAGGLLHHKATSANLLADGINLASHLLNTSKYRTQPIVQP
jgi:hypothetical protein